MAGSNASIRRGACLVNSIYRLNAQVELSGEVYPFAGDEKDTLKTLSLSRDEV